MTDRTRLAEVLCTLAGNDQLLREWKHKSQLNLDYLRIERVARQTLAIYAEALGLSS
jgi:hypothetical protein